MAKDSVFTAPWYPWYVNDVLRSESIEMLTLAEEGAYRRALDRAWINGSIPADPKRCAELIGNGCTPKIAERILLLFVPMQKDSSRMVNKKLEKVRKEQREKFKKKSDDAKAAARSRWKQRDKVLCDGIADALPQQCHRDTDTESSSYEEDSKNSHTTHPAIIAMQDITGMMPAKDQQAEIIERLGVDVDIGKLKDVYRKWRVRGYGKTNYDGIIDWYISGIPKAGKTNGTSNKFNNGHKPTPGEIIANRPYRTGTNTD